MTSLSKKPVTKKRGRPIGSKNKKKPVAKRLVFKGMDLQRKAQQSLARLNDIGKRIDELESIRTNLHRVIDNLEHQAVQYRAVIDYLETKLELK
jgi:hypothetical protein